jgi:CDP-diacylglycerol--serine O-phosphatidyltransferase
LKRIRIQHHQVIPALLVVGVVAAFLTTAPWPLMTAVGLLYAASIPFSVARFYKLKRLYDAGQPAAAPAGAAAEAGEVPPPPAAEPPGAFTRH